MAALKHNLKGAFSSTKDELDQHLESINQNTNEIATNYEMTLQLEGKIEKLAEKIDEIYMHIKPHSYYDSFEDIKLSRREQELFLGIYTESDRVSIRELSKKLGLTPEMCEALISALKSKKIPVVRQLVNEEMFVSLDYTFKDLQARKNVLKIETSMI